MVVGVILIAVLCFLIIIVRKCHCRYCFSCCNLVYSKSVNEMFSVNFLFTPLVNKTISMHDSHSFPSYFVEQKYNENFSEPVTD